MNLSVDFPLILSSVVILTGVVTLIDMLFLAKKRKAKNKKQPWWVEYSRSFFPVLFLVWGVRSFVIQPYRVPTGSLEPTVVPGDFIAVKQYEYGLRLPVIRKKILDINEPKVGQIALFHWPVDPKIIFVKRVIGVPGDHIVYKNKVLTINGKVMKQTFVKDGYDQEPGQKSTPVVIKREDLNGIEHEIQVRKGFNESGGFALTVPKGMYFMMGDNRDNSDDSRFWGFVPEKDLIGEAFGIFMSWNSNTHSIRWNRIGKGLS